LTITLTIRIKAIAKERTGKVQRWILIHTYLKTTKKKLPDDWRLPNLMESKKLDAYFWTGLYKSEVLLNYFKLEPGYKKQHLVWSHGDYPIKADPMAEYFDRLGPHILPEADFLKTAQRDKAVVSSARTKSNMEQKGLLGLEPGFGPNAERITLTKAGKAKAQEIINRAKKKRLPERPVGQRSFFRRVKVLRGFNQSQKGVRNAKRMDRKKHNGKGERMGF
jgi:hypothetical protein